MGKVQLSSVAVSVYLNIHVSEVDIFSSCAIISDFQDLKLVKIWFLFHLQPISFNSFVKHFTLIWILKHLKQTILEKYSNNIYKLLV